MTFEVQQTLHPPTSLCAHETHAADSHDQSTILVGLDIISYWMKKPNTKIESVS